MEAELYRNTLMMLYISLLIIPCIIYYVTNKETLSVVHSRRCPTAIIILPSFHESLKHIYYVHKLVFWMWLIVWRQSESLLDFEGWAVQKHSYDAKMPCFMNLWCILVRELTRIWDSTAVIVHGPHGAFLEIVEVMIFNCSALCNWKAPLLPFWAQTHAWCSREHLQESVWSLERTRADLTVVLYWHFLNFPLSRSYVLYLKNIAELSVEGFYHAVCVCKEHTFAHK